MSEQLQKELEHVRRELSREREHWATERTQYQQRITELQIRLGERVQAASERKQEIVARVAVLRRELEKPGIATAERNALAVELSQLEPQIG